MEFKENTPPARYGQEPINARYSKMKAHGVSTLVRHSTEIFGGQKAAKPLEDMTSTLVPASSKSPSVTSERFRTTPDASTEGLGASELDRVPNNY
ncbi:uncharacterized protein TEOVI_000197900 [Trypanosoma equiperdum]|uniref:Uncharacterized protein n=1 Tax=Trypanosoma equiperdum TaxID=5694 RepID=A0A1G4IDK2_TRYEQ|nr:hypothetical protein TEOVI_000197900 [Trypanosoma equiperdum]